MTATKSADVGTSAYRGGALREDLANFISNIDRSETPFLSTIGTTKATLARHEWQIDTYAAAGRNQVAEDFEFATGDNSNIVTDRLSNYTQVNGKTVHISGSLIESNPAGAANWFAYSMKKRGVEMKRDEEVQALYWERATNADRTAYKTDDTRSAGSLFAYAGNWIRGGNQTVEANNSSNTGTAMTTTQNAAFNVADVITSFDAETHYGQKAVQFTTTSGLTYTDMTVDHVTDLLEVMFENGGKPSAAQVPSGLKSYVSKLLIDGNGGAAERRASEMSKKVNLAVDSVMTEFGFDISLIPNYLLENSVGTGEITTIFYDPSMIKKAILSGLKVQEDGTARYGKGAIMHEEWTLEVKNPNSVGIMIGYETT